MFVDIYDMPVREVSTPRLTMGEMLLAQSVPLREVRTQDELLAVGTLDAKELLDYLLQVTGCRALLEGVYYPVSNQAVWIPIMLLIAAD